jgi:hypothetical protein
MRDDRHFNFSQGKGTKSRKMESQTLNKMTSEEEQIKIDHQSSNATASKKESRLEQLSQEIFLAVVTQLPDIPSLYNLITASPAAFRLFDKHAVNITETILLDGIMSSDIPDTICTRRYDPVFYACHTQSRRFHQTGCMRKH